MGFRRLGFTVSLDEQDMLVLTNGTEFCNFAKQSISKEQLCSIYIILTLNKCVLSAFVNSEEMYGMQNNFEECSQRDNFFQRRELFTFVKAGDGVKAVFSFLSEHPVCAFN